MLQHAVRTFIHTYKEHLIMAITNAVERDGFIYVYNEQGHNILTLGAGSSSNEGLKGYTSSTVNIERSGFIYTYNEQGHVINTTSA